VWVHFLEGEVAVYEAHAIPKTLDEHFNGRRSLFAVRTFEVAVLDERDGRVFGPARVVDGVDGLGQVRRAWLDHG
jgi:hypothetical protein